MLTKSTSNLLFCMTQIICLHQRKCYNLQSSFWFGESTLHLYQCISTFQIFAIPQIIQFTRILLQVQKLFVSVIWPIHVFVIFSYQCFRGWYVTRLGYHWVLVEKPPFVIGGFLWDRAVTCLETIGVRSSAKNLGVARQNPANIIFSSCFTHQIYVWYQRDGADSTSNRLGTSFSQQSDHQRPLSHTCISGGMFELAISQVNCVAVEIAISFLE
jgi:hypothetical protein